MDVGVVFPQTEIGNDPGAIKAYGRAMRGITHLSISTMGLGLEKPDQHVDLLREVREVVRTAGLGR